MPTVAFHTLGCKVNFYDTEAIWQLFAQSGYEQVEFESSQADVYVINTCTVTNTGDKKSRQMIRRAIRRNPDAVIAVTGCYAQTSPAEILAIPGVDLVIGTQGRDEIVDLVHRVQEERQPVNAVRNIMKTRQFEELDVPYFADRTRAFLKIQEGCNNFCTFCIIPWSRGLLRSRDPKSVIEQAQALVKAGYQEIVLTGIHTAGYGEDLVDYHLADLLRDLDRQVTGLHRIRISSIEASQITDEVIDVLMSSNKFCRHLHVPLQAGDDDVLKRMRRKYTTAEYAAKIARIRERWPEVSITTDLIVGFPGETQEMFENGLEFIQSMQFAEMHVFPYSKRTGTPAARMEEQIAEEVKNERVHQLIDCSETMQLNYAEQFVGQILTMIPERESIDEQGERQLTGYTDNYLQVTVPSAHATMGQPLAIQLLEAGVNECKGQLAQEISAGGVVFRKRGQGGLEIQLIKDRYGQITLAKGKMEPGESIEQTALREVQEETGLEGVIVDSLAPVHYQYLHPNKGLIDKIVHYYLIEASKTEPLVAQLEEIQDVDWYIPEVAWQMQIDHGYRNNDAILQIALKKLGVGDGLQSVTNS